MIPIHIFLASILLVTAANAVEADLSSTKTKPVAALPVLRARRTSARDYQGGGNQDKDNRERDGLEGATEDEGEFELETITTATPSAPPSVPTTAATTVEPTTPAPTAAATVTAPEPTTLEPVPSPSPTPEPTNPELFPDTTFDDILCNVPLIGLLCTSTEATTSSPSASPTGSPTTSEPTAFPTTSEPTASPTTEDILCSIPLIDLVCDILNPGTEDMTSSPSASPSASPTQPEPTASPTTSEPTASPTTSEPTASPTTVEPTAFPTVVVECPANDAWDPYTLPELETDNNVDIFSYYQESYALLGQIIDKTFTVKDTCVYAELGSDGSELNFERPEEWLDSAVLHFEGVPGINNGANGAKFTGTAVPRADEIVIVRTGVLEYCVRIVASSAAIAGDETLQWDNLPGEDRAIEFKNFLLAIIDSAPEVFLTNQSNRCGSGPFCLQAGPEACFLDPTTGVLHVEWSRGTSTEVESYSDAFEWFQVCAASFHCQRINTGGEFQYVQVPDVAKIDTIFKFGGNAVDGAPIEFECASELEAYQLYQFARTAAQDPLCPMAVGGPYERAITAWRQ